MAYRDVLPTFGAAHFPGPTSPLSMPAAILPGGPQYQSGGPRRDLTGIFGINAPPPRPPQPLRGLGDAEDYYRTLRSGGVVESYAVPSDLESIYRLLRSQGSLGSSSLAEKIDAYERTEVMVSPAQAPTSKPPQVQAAPKESGGLLHRLGLFDVEPATVALAAQGGNSRLRALVERGQRRGTGLGGDIDADEATKTALTYQARNLRARAQAVASGQGVGAGAGDTPDSILAQVQAALQAVSTYLAWDAPFFGAYDSSQTVKANLYDAEMFLQGMKPPQAQDVNLLVETAGNVPASFGLPSFAPSEQTKGSISEQEGKAFSAQHPASDYFSWGPGGKYGPGAGEGGLCSFEAMKPVCSALSGLGTAVKVGLGVAAAGGALYGGYKLERYLRSRRRG